MVNEESSRSRCRHGWIGGLLALLLLSLAPPIASAQTLGTVTGTVVDAEEGAPLVGAEVRLRDVDDPTVLQATNTDSDGNFQLPRIRPGRYLIEVSYLGYRERAIPLILEVGESRNLEIELWLDPSSLETAVITPSRKQQQLLEAPASVSVLEPERIRREAATSSVEALRSLAGVDVAQTGVDRREVALRGFNGGISSAPHVLVDHREAAAPALGLNLYSVMPNTALDVKRIEAVHGPAAALYGSGVDGGVIHFFTKGPFQDPGTSIALSGGSRAYRNAQFRKAGVIGDHVGYKFTGQWGEANEWQLDPDDPQDAAEIDRYRVYDDPEADALVGRNFVERDVDGDGDLDAQLRRKDRYRRYNANGLLTYRFDDETTLALSGGYASLTTPLQTALGTVQASRFQYGYGQLRLNAGSFSGHIALNRNLSGDEVYLYRTGETIADEGTQVDVQGQYSFGIDAMDTNMLVGGEVDVWRRTPKPTILRRYDEDQSRMGAYFQTTTTITPSLDFTLALRSDYLSIRDEVQISPRAALVYTPTSNHALRASYNRAVSVPASSPLVPIPMTDVPSPPHETTTETYEVGYKGQVGGRLWLSVDGYSEIRENVLVPVGSPPSYRQSGEFQYYGLNVSAEVRPTDALTLFGNTSVVSDDFFELDALDAADPTRRSGVALNASPFKVKGGFDYGLPGGVTVGATVHHVDEFYMQLGPYSGTVDAYTLLDVRFRSTVPAVPGLSLNLTAKNVLGNEHREFVGAPQLGRMMVARLTYEFPQ